MDVWGWTVERVWQELVVQTIVPVMKALVDLTQDKVDYCAACAQLFIHFLRNFLHFLIYILTNNPS